MRRAWQEPPGGTELARHTGTRARDVTAGQSERAGSRGGPIRVGREPEAGQSERAGSGGGPIRAGREPEAGQLERAGSQGGPIREGREPRRPSTAQVCWRRPAAPRLASGYGVFARSGCALPAGWEGGLSSLATLPLLGKSSRH